MQSLKSVDVRVASNLTCANHEFKRVVSCSTPEEGCSVTPTRHNGRYRRRPLRRAPPAVLAATASRRPQSTPTTARRLPACARRGRCPRIPPPLRPTGGLRPAMHHNISPRAHTNSTHFTITTTVTTFTPFRRRLPCLPPKVASQRFTQPCKPLLTASRPRRRRCRSRPPGFASRRPGRQFSWTSPTCPRPRCRDLLDHRRYSVVPAHCPRPSAL